MPRPPSPPRRRSRRRRRRPAQRRVARRLAAAERPAARDRATPRVDEVTQPLVDARDGGPAVGAAIDLGATSVHMLVSAFAGSGLRTLDDESVFLGLGRRVGEFGYLGREARDELTQLLEAYALKARQLGASGIGIVGTEPLRRAADAALVVHESITKVGVPVHVLDHEEEALLTVIGVLAGEPIDDDLLIVDVGGGSTELSSIGPAASPRVAGLRLGAATLTDRLVAHDPPTVEEFEALRRAAEAGLREAQSGTPRTIIGVGGTASNLLKLTTDGTGDRRLTPARLTAAVAELSSHPAATLAERHLINPMRAKLLAAGAAIVGALLDRYGATQMHVSEAGIREGTILAMRHGGISWRDRLRLLAEGKPQAS